MSNLGVPAQLRSAVGGSEGGMQHLPGSSPSLVNSNASSSNPYAQTHQLPSHHHNSQFLYGNGDLPALQASQFRTDIFNPEMNWQQQQSQQQSQQHHHQVAAQGFPSQHFNPSSTLPEHAAYRDPVNSHLQPFAGHVNAAGWPPPLEDPTAFAQHESTISPAQISNGFTNARQFDNGRPLNTYAPVKQAGPFADSTTPLQSNPGLAESTMVNGYPQVSVHCGDQFPDMLEAIETLGYLGDSGTSTVLNKKPRLSTPASANSLAAAFPVPAPVTAKSGSKLPMPPTPKSKVPVEPLARLKYLLQECLDADDDDDAIDIAAKAWGIITDISAEQSDMITVAVATIQKNADDDTLVQMGKIVPFTVRLRKWIVAEHNKDKKSPLIPKMLKLLSQIKMGLKEYESQKWDKVLNAISKRSELEKSKDFANNLITRFQHLGKERARKEREATKAYPTNTDKQSAVTLGVVKKEPNSNLNAGVKRTIEEVGKGTTANASKKVALGDVRNPVSSPNISKSAGPSVPARNGASSSNVGDKKSTASATTPTGQASSSTVATASAKSKPTASSWVSKTLGKSAESAKVQSKVPEKMTSTQTSSSSTTSFTSIFAQLQQRQKEQDLEKKKDAASKAAEAARGTDDDKKKKKKKSVRWKTGDDLVKVQVFEWQEPEGEYYGGGSGMAEHGWGDSTGEGEALKNKVFVEEEVDLMEWHQPKPVDFNVLYKKKSDAQYNPEKRGGDAVVESEEAKTQAQRELVTLAAFYNSPRDIPASPKEPDEPEDTNPTEEPTEIQLSDEVKARLGVPVAPVLPISQPSMPQTTDLSSLLSAIQQPQVRANPAQDIFSTLQAFGQVQQQQQQPQVAASQPQQLDLTSLLSAVSGQQQQQIQSQQSIQPNFLQSLMQPQTGQNPASAVADLLARLTGGMTAANPQTGFAAQNQIFQGIGPPQQQQQQQQQPPTAPRAWNGGYDAQIGMGYADQRDDRNTARDVRRELRDAVGWSDNDIKETPATGGTSGNAGGKWGGKKKKEKKQKQTDAKNAVLCLFFQKGNCKHGDSCRFSHDPNAVPPASGGGGGGGGGAGGSSGTGSGGTGGGGGGGWKTGKKRHGGHASRGWDQGAGAGAAGWPGAGELEY